MTPEITAHKYSLEHYAQIIWSGGISLKIVTKADRNVYGEHTK